MTAGCCTSCRGTGRGGPASAPETDGRCADCQATGHDHPAGAPCATGDRWVRIVADVIDRTTRATYGLCAIPTMTTAPAILDALKAAGWMPPADVDDLPAIDGSTLPKILGAATIDEAAATLAQASAFAARLAILGDAPHDVAYWAAVAGHAAARLAALTGAGAGSPEHAGTDANMPVPAC